jgi:flagellin-specific chaperone FliS
MSKIDYEVSEVNYILQGLYDERIYGLNNNNSRSDGTIQTNVDKLIKQLNNMVRKISNDELDNNQPVFRIEKGLK